MDGRIWSDLPECLLERIIARLPVITICKLRCVCKKWNSLPFSPSFPELSSTSLERPYLVFPSINSNACKATLSTFCPTLSQWYDLPLNRQHPELNLHIWLPGQKSLIGADAGLLCFSSTTQFPEDHSTTNNNTRFIVVNPISNAWKQLPPIVHNQFARLPWVTGLHVDPLTKHLQLIVGGYFASNGDSSSPGTWLYDSRSHSWEQGCSIDSRSDLSSTRQCKFYDGSFYCLNYYPRVAIRRYSARERLWRVVDLNIPPFKRYPGLLERNGRLLLVGPVQDGPCQRNKAINDHLGNGDSAPSSLTSDFCDVPNTIEIYELNAARMEWMKVEAKPPPDGFADLFQGPFRFYFVQCVGQGDVIYVSRDDASAVVEFDFSERSWRWLPDNRHTIHSKDSWQVLAFNLNFSSKI